MFCPVFIDRPDTRASFIAFPRSFPSYAIVRTRLYHERRETRTAVGVTRVTGTYRRLARAKFRRKVATVMNNRYARGWANYKQVARIGTGSRSLMHGVTPSASSLTVLTNMRQRRRPCSRRVPADDVSRYRGGKVPTRKNLLRTRKTSATNGIVRSLKPRFAEATGETVLR